MFIFTFLTFSTNVSHIYASTGEKYSTLNVKSYRFQQTADISNKNLLSSDYGNV